MAIGCVKCRNLKGSWKAHRRWQCKHVTDIIPPSSTATSMYYRVSIERSYCGIRQHSFNTVPQSIPWITEQHRAGGGSREQMVRQGGRCVSIMYLLSHAKYMSRNRSPRSAWRCCVKLHGKLQDMEWKGMWVYVWSWMFGFIPDLAVQRMFLYFVRLCQHLSYLHATTLKQGS